jgi:hypothetical protein
MIIKSSIPDNCEIFNSPQVSIREGVILHKDLSREAKLVYAVIAVANGNKELKEINDLIVEHTGIDLDDIFYTLLELSKYGAISVTLNTETNQIKYVIN